MPHPAQEQRAKLLLSPSFCLGFAGLLFVTEPPPHLPIGVFLGPLRAHVMDIRETLQLSLDSWGWGMSQGETAKKCGFLFASHVKQSHTVSS